MSIKGLPILEQPREKAIRLGIEKLSNAELIAILLRSGSKEYSVIELAYKVLDSVGGLSNLANITYSELAMIKGLKQAKSLSLLATIEIAKRINFSVENLKVMNSPDNIFYLFEPMLRNAEQEINYCVFLNSKGKMITFKKMFVGGLDRHLIHPRDIFREAIRLNSAGIVLVHNHPSGDPTPSKADIETTISISNLGIELGIVVLDHIIIGKGRFISLKSEKFF